MNPETENLQEANISIRVSMRGMLRMIWVYTLRRDHNVGFLAGRLIYKPTNLRLIMHHSTQRTAWTKIDVNIDTV